MSLTDRTIFWITVSIIVGCFGFIIATARDKLPIATHEAVDVLTAWAAPAVVVICVAVIGYGFRPRGSR